MSASPLVLATHLTRSFGTRVAVSDLTLAIGPGEVVVLLGPNGAGKTTTLRMLAGLIAPSSGEVVIDGVRLSRETADDLRASIGLLTEAPGLWDRLSVGLNLMTYARLHAVPRPGDATARALALVGLSDRARDGAGTLSKGLRQRLALARALVHEPRVLLLDEPTSGLDPASARQVRDLIGDLRRQGRALLVSTHNLSEAEELADRIAILNTRLLACDEPAALRRLTHGVRVDVEVEGDASAWTTAAIPFTREPPAIAGSILSATLDSGDRSPDLVAALVAAGARIRRVAPVDRSLEEVYLTLVGHPEAGA